MDTRRLVRNPRPLRRAVDSPLPSKAVRAPTLGMGFESASNGTFFVSPTGRTYVRNLNFRTIDSIFARPSNIVDAPRDWFSDDVRPLADAFLKRVHAAMDRMDPRTLVLVTMPVMFSVTCGMPDTEKPPSKSLAAFSRGLPPHERFLKTPAQIVGDMLALPESSRPDFWRFKFCIRARDLQSVDVKIDVSWFLQVADIHQQESSWRCDGPIASFIDHVVDSCMVPMHRFRDASGPCIALFAKDTHKEGVSFEKKAIIIAGDVLFFTGVTFPCIEKSIHVQLWVTDLKMPIFFFPSCLIADSGFYVRDIDLRVVAFLCGLHPRLGADSHASLLSSDIAQMCIPSDLLYGIVEMNDIRRFFNIVRQPLRLLQ